MGMNYHVKEIECTCGHDWGSCSYHNIFMMKYNRTCDLGTLLIKNHSENENSKWERLGTFTDEDISALIDVLSGNGEHISKEQLEETKDIY